MAAWRRAKTRMRLLGVVLVCGSILVLVSACIGSAENPAGYPPIPNGGQVQAAPTKGGAAPTVVGADSPQGKLEKKQQQHGAVTAPGSGSTGLPPTDDSTGKANATQGTPTPTPQTAVTVTLMPDSTFSPQSLTIHVGQAVLFVNQSRAPQTATDDASLAANSKHAVLPAGAVPWNTGIINPGEKAAQLFSVEGKYTYFSIPSEHVGMIGHITVRP